MYFKGERAGNPGFALNHAFVLGSIWLGDRVQAPIAMEPPHPAKGLPKVNIRSGRLRLLF